MRSGVAVQWRIPDELWQRIEPVLPRRWWKRSKKGGRPRVPARQVMDGIFYVLRTGIQWKAVPPEFGAGSTLHAYFQELVARKVFRRLWTNALLEYDELKGIQWNWQSIDGAMTKAPLGGEKNRRQSHRSRQAGDQALAAH
jgi:transposase